MVSINYSSREVCCKIVYYGPGLSGKTTNLQYIHTKVPKDTRGNLISLATEADRTLFFDFLPINIGTINGFAAKFQLYTVPGQVYYNATRKLVLRGVDGIVFVADSQPDKMSDNFESFNNLADNLKEYGYDINDIPLVIQYNKRDLPGVLTVDELNKQFNSLGAPIFEASANVGTGVFDTLKLIIRMVLDKAKGKSSSKSTARPATASTASAAVQTAPAAPSMPAPAPSAAAPSQATAVAAYPSPAAAEPQVDVSRPYPGSQPAVVPKKISSAGLASSNTEVGSGQSLGNSAISDSALPQETADSTPTAPFMAPSLKRKLDGKKRGLIKRLFGIK